MTAKEWLMRAWKIDREINILLEVQKSVYDRLTGITAAGDNTPVSGTKDPHRFDSYTELNDKIDRRIDELCAIKAEIFDLIEKIPDIKLRGLLIDRYINCLTFQQIADKMEISPRWVMSLHKRALNLAEKFINRS